jgi:soluble lytic murein transglycosylase-like protein
VLSNAPAGHGPVSTPAQTVRVGSPSIRLVSSDYDSLIAEHSTRQGVRPDLVRAIIQVESAFNRRAVSPKGAMGLMQLMPATAAQLGVVDAFSPAENIRAGVQYLKQLLLRYQDNEQLALAAYNAGPLAVERHGNRVPPYPETQDYVRRISAIRGTSPPARATRIYKSVDLIDGRPVVRYSDKPAASGGQVAQ